MRTIARAVVIGNGVAGAQNQCFGLFRALGLSDKYTLYVSSFLSQMNEFEVEPKPERCRIFFELIDATFYLNLPYGCRVFVGREAESMRSFVGCQLMSIDD